MVEGRRTFSLAGTKGGPAFGQPGDIAWIGFPGPQGGWGRFRTGEDGKSEFMSFIRIPPTEEELAALVKIGIAWKNGGEDRDGR